jgi:triacylglycerol lipase
MAVAPSERGAYYKSPPADEGIRPPISAEIRAVGEFFNIVNYPVYWGVGVPRGDGSRVLTVPGFTASDASLFFLNRYLRRINYEVVTSGIAYHGDPKGEIVRLSRMVKSEYERTGERYHIVGHSLGGVVGRGISHLVPEAVESFSALGSPIGSGEKFEEAVNPLVMGWARATVPGIDSGKDFAKEMAIISEPIHPSIKTTYYFTRDDGVVHYPFTQDKNPGSQNVEVPGTHSGLVANPHVFERLAHSLFDVSRNPEPRGKILDHPAIKKAGRPAA